MTIFGIGPLLAIAGGIPLAVISLLQRLRGIRVSLPSPFRQVSRVLGIALFAAGACLWLSSGIRLKKAFPAHRLETSGAFRLTRNPLYAAFIVFMAPGAALVFDNLLLLAPPLAMFVAFKLKIGEEEGYLLREFGEEYLQYEREVPQLVPFIRRSGRG